MEVRNDFVSTWVAYLHMFSRDATLRPNKVKAPARETGA